MVKELLPLFPKEYKTYVEPFFGAGWLYFAKDPSTKHEIINDLDNNLINFYKVIQNNYEEFVESFKYTLVARKTYEDYTEKYRNHDYKNEIEQAHIFYYLIMGGFGGDMQNPSFGTGTSRASSINLEAMPKIIEKAHKRLIRATIECKDYKEIIKKYDTKDTFFFLDPPYKTTKAHLYPSLDGKEFDFKELADILKTIKGKFILTLNSHEEIDEYFKEFKHKQIGNNYTNNRRHYAETKDNKTDDEVIYMNYEI